MLGVPSKMLERISASSKPVICKEKGEWCMYSDVTRVSMARSLKAAQFVDKLNAYTKHDGATQFIEQLYIDSMYR